MVPVLVKAVPPLAVIREPRHVPVTTSGQMPIYRRLPKFGFKNINRIEYVGINIDVLNSLAETKNITDFNVDVFKQNGLISGKDRIKILGRGELNATINVTAHAFSAAAKQAIEAKGGVATVIE